MRSIILIAALLLSACATRIHDPQIVYVTKTVYVPIDDQLIVPHPIANGSLAECPEVAAERKKELIQCNLDKAGIKNISGTQKIEDEP